MQQEAARIYHLEKNQLVTSLISFSAVKQIFDFHSSIVEKKALNSLSDS